MSVRGYKIRDQYAKHYFMFTVIDWIDVLPESVTKTSFLIAWNIAKRKNNWLFMKNLKADVNGYLLCLNEKV